MATRNNPCPQCGKKMKSTSGLTRHMNTCTSQTYQQVLTLRMQPEQNMPMAGEDNNSSDNYRSHKDEEPALNAPDI